MNEADQPGSLVRNPRLTVLTTVYNAERYIAQAIESILVQDFTDFEYLIIDDGSTDGTPEILRSLAQRDPRIRVDRIAQNVGMAKALNRGLQLARGEYIGKQDGDDLCRPSRLRAQVELLDRRPDVALVSANFSDIDAQGRWAGDWIIENPPARVSYLLIFSNAATGAGCQGMFRLETARELGGFSEALEASIDYEFWTRLVRRGSFVILSQVGLIRRLHDNQMSRRLQPQQLHNSLSISRRMLAAHLDRAVSEEELSAVASIWRQLGHSGVSASANRVLREAYARFADVEADPRLRRRVCRVTASNWAISGLLLLRRGFLREGLLHLITAQRWHPRALTDAIAFTAHRLRVRLRRMRLTGTDSGEVL